MWQAWHEEQRGGGAGRRHAPNVRRAIPPTLGPERALRRAPAAESAATRLPLPRRILRLNSNRRPVRPCLQLARIDYQTPHRRRRLRFNAPRTRRGGRPRSGSSTTRCSKPRLRHRTRRLGSWNPPPPPLKSQPRKRKLTSDAEHTLFRPGYVPLDPEETSRGARDILAAVNAGGGAKTGEGSLRGGTRSLSKTRWKPRSTVSLGLVLRYRARAWTRAMTYGIV